MAWVIKGFLSVLVLLMGYTIHQLGYDEGAQGAAAASLAVCTGIVLFLDLLPNGSGLNGMIAVAVTRLVGTILAFGTGWNWLYSETNGAMWPYVLPLVIFALFALSLGTVAITLMFLPLEE